MGHWLNPDRGEMFFAKRAVFVEGETERVALPYLADRLGCIDREVSVIDCGSKHNLPLYIAIANAFEVPYTVVHDEDPVPETRPEDAKPEFMEEKRRTFELNETIKQEIRPDLGRVFVLSPDFEGTAGVSRTQGRKVGKALAALEHFREKGPEHVPEALRTAVRLAFCGVAHECEAGDCRLCEHSPARATA
jgi:CRISPR-associated exonuclease Cas4